MRKKKYEEKKTNVLHFERCINVGNIWCVGLKYRREKRRENERRCAARVRARDCTFERGLYFNRETLAALTTRSKPQFRRKFGEINCVMARRRV